jgi:hypothetical protein
MPLKAGTPARLCRESGDRRGGSFRREEVNSRRCLEVVAGRGEDAAEPLEGSQAGRADRAHGYVECGRDAGVRWSITRHEDPKHALILLW